MRQAVDIDEALALKLQKIARADGNADLEPGPTRSSKKQPRLAQALESISRGFPGSVRLAGVAEPVQAYARYGSVSLGEQFLVAWVAASELSEEAGDEDPQAGQWDVLAVDPNYAGFPSASRGCGCGDTVDGTANHDCSVCGCVNKRRYLYPPRLNVRWPDAEEAIYWEAASELQTLKYAGGCLWVTDWFDGPDCNADEYEEDSDEYRWEVDRELLRIRLVRRSVEYPNCPELYAEWCLTPACGLLCNGPWRGQLVDLKNIEQPDDCYICVTPSLRIAFDPGCWTCDYNPPDAYKMQVPGESTYTYLNEEGVRTTEPNRLAGTEITLRRIGSCVTWVVDPVSEVGHWVTEIGECYDLTTDPVVGAFLEEFWQPRYGNCNLYFYESTTTLVWLFVEMQPGSVWAEVTFVDTRAPHFPATISNRMRIGSRYNKRESVGMAPTMDGQQSDNWCGEESIELRSAFFDEGREYISNTVHWYETYADMQAQTGYAISPSQLNNDIFAVRTDEGVEQRTDWYIPTISTVPGETVWIFQGGGSLALTNSDEKGYYPAVAQGILTIQPTTLKRPTNTGKPGATCGGEETENTEECPADATCRWEEAFTEPIGVTCELVGSPGEWVPDESEVETYVDAMVAALPETASAEYEVIVGTCSGPGGTTVRLRYFDRVSDCPDGCEPCADPGSIENLTYKELGCNQA